MPIELRAAIPQWTVADLVATAEHYRDVLGFEISGYWQDPPVFAIVRRDRVQIFLSQAEPGASLAVPRADGAYNLYLEMAGVDDLAAELRGRGARIVEGPVDREYGQRELIFEDNNGLVIAAGEAIAACEPAS